MSEPAWVGLGGGEIDYVGAWSAGTAYRPGQVVRHNAVDYLAVNPSVGQTPPTVFGPIGAGYGTSLPASPIDGQEYILVDSLTDPTYTWRFRYNAGSTSPYKWEFVGGAPKVWDWYQGGAGMNHPAFAAASSWYWWESTAGSTFLVPRSGDYYVRAKQGGANGYGSPQTMGLTVASMTAAPAINVGNFVQTSNQGGNWTYGLFTAGLIQGAVAGTHRIGSAWQADYPASVNLGWQYVEITPRRVA